MCVFCTEELQQQHEVLRVVGRQAQASEAQEISSQRELNTTQQQLQGLRHTQRHSSQLQQEWEVCSQAINTLYYNLTTSFFLNILA